MVARVRDLELFKHIIHERGTLFYVEDEGGTIKSVAYFSSSRTAVYEGQVPLPEDFAKIVRGAGFKVAVLELDDVSERLRVRQ